MKKRKIFIFFICFISIFIMLILLDFVSVKLRNKPLVYVKQTNEEKQMIIYNSLFYRVVECTAEEDNFTIMNYSQKIQDDYCPRTIKMEYNDGFFINSKGAKISKEEYDVLYKYYSISEINNMDYEDVKESLLKIKNSNNIKK